MSDEHSPDADRGRRRPIPIDPVPLRLAGAKASVSPERLPDLLRRAQADVVARLADYRRRYECVHEDDERAVFLVPTDHWREVGDRLGLRRREADAVRRAHDEQLRRLDEFDAALEIREAVVIGLPTE
jgi:hypothetical protein